MSVDSYSAVPIGTEMTEAPHPALTVAGVPASASLRDTVSLASQLVGHFADNVAACHTLPGEEMRGDVTLITQICLQLAIDMLDSGQLPDESELTTIRESAAQWAREGVPLGTILVTYHEGMRFGFELVTDKARSDDVGDLVSAMKLLIELLSLVTRTVASAYVEEQRLVAGAHHAAAQTLVSALLSGHATASLARQTGVTVAPRYQVVALTVPPHPDEHNPRLNSTTVARRKLRRLQAAIGDLFTSSALYLLSISGGTLLIPDDGSAPRITPERLAQLSCVAEVPVTATVVCGATDQIPELSERAHELMDLVRAIGKPDGLYGLADLLVEYQITRPGPARAHLASLLEPLDSHPELLDTLRTHLATGLNRKSTGRQMHIHPNTVDYRLRRIAATTGIDLAFPEGISRAHVALLARDLEGGSGGE
ncbi:helix-turn-helix domain-containing protein [Gordonia jinhuaensis]|uniref:Transcriptional regulator n=1 Tax=Gordonia jinhuaensis TaxID=1517702 RepID=A0A916SYN8_9ACTN|nr:PucR family transcriptional regulator [Gordonia jinhuaensis]GGB20264.1 transcriptional regulator [Gordonia jinhuaensis]